MFHTKRLLKAKEFAALLGLHYRRVLQLAREGRIPAAVRVGKRFWFDVARLDETVEALRRQERQDEVREREEMERQLRKHLGGGFR